MIVPINMALASSEKSDGNGKILFPSNSLKSLPIPLSNKNISLQRGMLSF
jgi:hypothetical protein